MRSSLGLLLVVLGVLQLVAVWAFALPRLMHPEASTVRAGGEVLEAPAPHVDVGHEFGGHELQGSISTLDFDALNRPW